MGFGCIFFIGMGDRFAFPVSVTFKKFWKKNLSVITERDTAALMSKIPELDRAIPRAGRQVRSSLNFSMRVFFSCQRSFFVFVLPVLFLRFYFCVCVLITLSQQIMLHVTLYAVEKNIRKKLYIYIPVYMYIFFKNLGWKSTAESQSV